MRPLPALAAVTAARCRGSASLRGAAVLCSRQLAGAASPPSEMLSRLILLVGAVAALPFPQLTEDQFKARARSLDDPQDVYITNSYTQVTVTCFIHRTRRPR